MWQRIYQGVTHIYHVVSVCLFLACESFESLCTYFSVSKKSTVCRHLLYSVLRFLCRASFSLTLLAIHLLLTLFYNTSFLWCEIKEHLLSIELRKLFNLCIFLKIVSKAQQKHLTLLLKED